jgi:hypothetical protein
VAYYQTKRGGKKEKNLSIHHTQHLIVTLPQRKFKGCDDNTEVYPSIKWYGGDDGCGQDIQCRGRTEERKKREKKKIGKENGWGRGRKVNLMNKANLENSFYPYCE